MQISFYSFLFSIAISSIFIVLLYFFRKKIAFCNYCGLYTILGLYAVTFVRMVFPFEFKFTYTVSDKNVYAAAMDVLTPNKDVLFVPEFTWLNLLVSVWIVGAVIYISRVMIKYYKAVKALKANVIDGTPEMQAKLDLISQNCGIRRKVKLKITDCVISLLHTDFSILLFLFRIVNLTTGILDISQYTNAVI